MKSTILISKPVAMLACFLILLTTLVASGLSSPTGGDSAQAAPAGSEMPASWSISSNVATGTMPSGVIVTATLTGPATFNGTGPLVGTGARPAYMPATDSLKFLVNGCTNTAVSGCGSITYAFSKPVMAPVFYTADLGGTLGNPATDFSNYPVTLTSGGTFSLDSAASQSPQMSIFNSGSTVGNANPSAIVGQPSAGQALSCGSVYFGCGAYRIATPTRFVTSFTMGLGFLGTAAMNDGFTQQVAATPIAPSLSLAKTATPTTVTAAGQTVNYSFAVTNSGNTDLTNVVVNETAFTGTGTMGTVSCPTTSLAVGATTTCTATYTTTQADVDAGQISNTATATGTIPTGGTTMSTPSSAVVIASQSPAITVVKSASPAGPGAFVAGQVITYTFLTTNTGNVTLSNIAVNETAFTGSGTISPAACPPGDLAPGAQATCTATYTLTQTDVDNGSVTNTATAAGTPPGTAIPSVSTPSIVTIPVSPAPAITLTKSADRTVITAAGQHINYSFSVTNTGNVALTSVTVNETAFSGAGAAPAVTCPAGAASMAPGATVTCTATYTTTQADIDAGQLTNTATATGTPPGTTTPPVSTPSTVTIPATQSPAITMVKSATPSGAAAYTVGQLITYSFLVTNTGNVTQTNVTVVETAFTGSGSMSAVTCPSGVASLAPSASVACTATYRLTQADIDRGTTTNTATATGTPPSGPPSVSTPSTVTIPGAQTPEITIVKSADRTAVTAAGQAIMYSFLVTNIGNVTLSNVSADETAFSGTGTAPVITCPAGAASLIPGAAITCTASYTVTQADLDAGQITNTAIATGTPPTGTPLVSTPSSVRVTAASSPALTVVKSASPSDRSGFVAGQPIKYSFVVSNTGNVTLTDVRVTEGTFTGTGTLSSVTCPTGAASLAPRTQITCTATYAITQADVDAGSITNDATAIGTPPTGGPQSSPPTTVTVPTPQHPAVTVAKTADRATVVTAGQMITYSFLLTNAGNVTLTSPTVHEGSFNGSGSLTPVVCPSTSASLLPGVQVTCTATYTVVAADLTGGKILSNTATAMATPPGGGAISSPPSTARVSTPPGVAVETGGYLVGSKTPATLWWLILTGGGLLLAACTVVFTRRRRKG